MQRLQPVQPRTSPSKTFVSQDLDTCTHVFVRVDAVKKPLQQPYQGPFKVLSRRRKTVTVDKDGKADTISIDRVKPAYLLHSDPAVINTIGQNVATNTTRHQKTVTFLLPRH